MTSASVTVRLGDPLAVEERSVVAAQVGDLVPASG